MNSNEKRALGALAALAIVGVIAFALQHGARVPVTPAEVPYVYHRTIQPPRPKSWVPVDQWNYAVANDPISGAPTKTACINSENSVSLGAPYGDVTAMLCLRKSKRHGLDAFVQLNGKGQIICDISEGCTVPMRFDDHQARFGGRGAADYSSDVIFIVPAAKFAAQLKTADATAIELTFYDAGAQTLQFKTKGLSW